MTSEAPRAIHLVLAVTPDFLMGAAVSLRSAGETLDEPYRLVAHIHCSASRRRHDLEASLVDLPISISWESPSVELDALPRATSRMPPIGFQRIYAADQLSVPGNRILYLDADLLVRHSLHVLWEMDLEGRAVGAVQDPLLPFVSSRGAVQHWEAAGLDRATPHFNSGVMLIDQVAWRRDELTRRTVAYYCERASTIRVFDQEALNMVLRGDWTALPTTWNAGAATFSENFTGFAVLDRSNLDEARADPAIVHFTGTKPWSDRCNNPWAGEWRAALGRTTWAGSRPTTSSNSRRIATRLRKAVSVLRHG